MSTPSARQPAGIPAGGQFAPTSHAEPGIVLSGGRAEFVNDQHLYERELAALVGADAVLEENHPETRAKAKQLLKNARGEADGRIRLVTLDHMNAPEAKIGERVEIVGPKDGRPIIVDVVSGLPRLKVASGRAIIRMRSSWGNSLDVGPGAEAIVIAPSDIKVTAECEEGGQLTLACPSQKNRINPYGRGEIFLSTGTDTDRIPYERPVFRA